jgi:hypothetical protein
MKTAIGVALVLAAVAGLSACATSGAPTAVLSEEDRCTRYGGLWSAPLGRCMHPGSGGGM